MPLYFKVKNNQCSLPLKNVLAQSLYDSRITDSFDCHSSPTLPEYSSTTQSPFSEWLSCENSGKMWNAQETNINLPPVEIANVFQDMVQNSFDNTCLIIRSPTGSGKTVIAPFVAYQSVREMGGSYRETSLSNFRGLHIVASAEQASQVAPFIHGYAQNVMNVDYWCEGVTEHCRNTHNIDPDSINYMITTKHFGIMALESESWFDTVILDEVHLLSPEIIYILFLIRTKLNTEKITRLIILSASLPQVVTDYLRDYLGNSRTEFMDPLNRKFGIQVLQFRLAADSINAAKHTEHPNLTDLECYQREIAHAVPNIDLIRKRVVHHITAILLQSFGACTDSKAHLDNGIVCFLPTPLEVMRTIREFFMHTKNSNVFGPMFRYIRGFPVYGTPRTDLIVLRENAAHQLVRIIFTTDTLSNGVTLPRISHVVDSGLFCYSRPDVLRGIEYSCLEWSDYSIRTQRMGRVGRTHAGFYHEVLSQQRCQQIMRSDHMIDRLSTQYNTSHLVNELDMRNDAMLNMRGVKLNTLLFQAGIQGLLGFHIGTTEERAELHPSFDEYGKMLTRHFGDLPLEYALFLSYCSSNRVLLSGTLFVASILGFHGAIKNPSGRDRFGRNSSKSLLNSWRSITFSSSKSDIEIFSEVILNVWMDKSGREDDCNQWISRLHLPQSVVAKENFNEDGLQELNRRFHLLVSGLLSIGMITKYSDIYDVNVSSLELKSIGEERRIIQLNDNGRRAYNISLIAAFGSRVLVQGSEAEKELASVGRRMYKMVNLDLSDQRDIKLVQGEINGAEDSMLAVYPNLVKRGTEDYFTQLLHQCSNIDFLTYANVYGSRNDSIDNAKKTLTIHLLNGTIVFKFESADTLTIVSDYRQTLRLMATAGRISSLSFPIYELSHFEFDKYITVYQDEDRDASATPILNWKKCAGVCTQVEY